jgi:uncharacterized protein YndB with AHSA1/START domain
MAYDLELEFILSGKPKRVMQLLTDPVLIRKWSGGEATFDNKPGGKVALFDGWMNGEVLKTSDTELAYTWKISEWGEEIKPTEVHFIVKGQDGGSKVIVKHTGFPDEEEMKSHKAGWTDYFFDPMEDFMLIIDKS